jgi:hypothetical protein
LHITGKNNFYVLVLIYEVLTWNITWYTIPIPIFIIKGLKRLVNHDIAKPNNSSLVEAAKQIKQK